MLHLQDVCKTYKKHDAEVRAMDHVTLKADSGEFLVVRGPSGAGKSTLLLAAGALLSPDSGTVEVDGRDPYKVSADGRAALRATRIGFVFQQFHLVPYLSVWDNVLAPTKAAPPSKIKAHAPERAEDLLERLQMMPRKTHLPSQLSTGERQRVAVARALINGPGLLLADEPTGNLDPENADIVLEALNEFVQQGGAVLVVTHHEHADRFATRTVQIENGAIKE